MADKVAADIVIYWYLGQSADSVTVSRISLTIPAAHAHPHRLQNPLKSKRQLWHSAGPPPSPVARMNDRAHFPGNFFDRSVQRSRMTQSRQ